MTNVRLSTSASAAEEFSKFKAKSSDSTIVTATADATALPRSVSLQVLGLASREREISDGFTELTDTVGSGNFRITLGTGEVTDITIDGSNNTLEGFVEAINNSGASVRAFILNDGSANPYRVVIESEETGSNQTIDAETGTHGSIRNSLNLAETETASDATLRLDPGGDFVDITSSTNTFTDVIQGVTFEAHKVDASTTVTIDIEKDIDAMVTAISGLVSAYNDVVSIIGEQAEVDPITNRGGPLIGDSTLITLKRQLSNVIASEIGSGTITSAIQIGIELDASGNLSVDEDELRSKLSSDFDDVKSFFAGSGSFADQLRAIADTFVDPVEGALVTRIEGTNKSIADLEQSISDAEERLDTVEQDLIQQFAALERIISDLQQQSLFLSQFVLAIQAR
jgi:flagellar hook-associated protein 2